MFLDMVQGEITLDQNLADGVLGDADSNTAMTLTCEPPGS